MRELQAGSTRRAWTQKGPTVCSVTALQTALECAGCARCVGCVECAQDLAKTAAVQLLVILAPVVGVRVAAASIVA